MFSATIHAYPPTIIKEGNYPPGTMSAGEALTRLYYEPYSLFGGLERYYYSSTCGFDPVISLGISAALFLALSTTAGGI